MTREEIIELAQECGLYSGNPRTPGTGNMIVRRLERFAALVAAAERERVIEDVRTVGGKFSVECEALIRARSGK